MDDMVSIRAMITPDEHRRAKAAAALAGEKLQDWAGDAIREKLAVDEAARQAPKREEVTDGNSEH